MPKSLHSIELSPKEYTVVRAHLLGFSEIALTQLMECSKQTLHALWFDLYKKFNVENSYLVVKKALQMGLISEENYLPEFTKEATLAFLEECGTLKINGEGSRKSKWETYQYLLKYHCYITGFDPNKKIPPKRD